MGFPVWMYGSQGAVVSHTLTDDEADQTVKDLDAIFQPEALSPELPAEVWNNKPVDAERCMAATRALCAGVG